MIGSGSKNAGLWERNGLGAFLGIVKYPRQNASAMYASLLQRVGVESDRS
jgi:hypothetical protein